MNGKSSFPTKYQKNRLWSPSAESIDLGESFPLVVWKAHKNLFPTDFATKTCFYEIVTAQLGGCGLVATTTVRTTTTLAAANLVAAPWWLRPRQLGDCGLVATTTATATTTVAAAQLGDCGLVR